MEEPEELLLPEMDCVAWAIPPFVPSVNTTLVHEVAGARPGVVCKSTFAVVCVRCAIHQGTVGLAGAALLIGLGLCQP